MMRNAITNIEARHRTVWLLFKAHLLLYGLSTRNTSYARLNVLLDWPKVLIPCRHDLSCRGWWIWKALFITEVMKQCIVLSKKGVLRHDLRCKKVGEE